MCKHKYEGQKFPTGRRSRTTAGFVHIGLLIGAILMVPLGFLLWPSVSSTIEVITTLSVALANAIQLVIWLAIGGVVIYAIRLVQRGGLITKLRAFWKNSN